MKKFIYIFFAINLVIIPPVSLLTIFSLALCNMVDNGTGKETENPFCPTSKEGLQFIADYHHSSVYKYDYFINKNDPNRKKILKEKADGLLKLIEEVGNKLAFSSCQIYSVSDKSFIWIAADPYVGNLISKYSFSRCSKICSILPESSKRYRVFEKTPTIIEIYFTVHLTDKIIVGVVDSSISRHVDNSYFNWQIGNVFGGKQYYAIIEINNYENINLDK